MTNKECVEKYKLLVFKLAHKYNWRDCFDDLSQEGYIALLRCNKSYKKSVGKSTFTSYAYIAIRNAMLTYIIKYGNIVRYDGNTIECLDIESICNKEDDIRIEEIYEKKDLVNKALDTMTNDRDKQIVMCYYGIIGPALTMKECGDLYEMTHAGISRILTKSLRILRRTMERNNDDILPTKQQKNKYKYKYKERVRFSTKEFRSNDK